MLARDRDVHRLDLGRPGRPGRLGRAPRAALEIVDGREGELAIEGEELVVRLFARPGQAPHAESGTASSY